MRTQLALIRVVNTVLAMIIDQQMGGVMDVRGDMDIPMTMETDQFLAELETAREMIGQIGGGS